MERDAHHKSLPLHNLQGPHKGGPLPGSPHKAPTERDAPFPEPSFNYLSEFLVNGPPPPPPPSPHAFQQGPYGERCPSLEPSSKTSPR